MVAVLHNAWHPHGARRYLPGQALSRPTHMEVLAAGPNDGPCSLTSSAGSGCTQVRCPSATLLHVLDAGGRLALRPDGSTRPWAVRDSQGSAAGQDDIGRPGPEPGRGRGPTLTSEHGFLGATPMAPTAAGRKLDCEHGGPPGVHYHCFEVGGERILRNALAMVITLAEAKGLSCYEPGMASHADLRPCLRRSYSLMPRFRAASTCSRREARCKSAKDASCRPLRPRSTAQAAP